MDSNTIYNNVIDGDKKDCPSIGFLTESLNGFYQSSVWAGASDEAIRRGYSLITFAGGSLRVSPWDEFEPQRNTIYNFIDTHHLCGLIISGSIGNFITEEEFARFCQRFTSIPMVCIGPEIKSVPTIAVDNAKGIQDLIAHLVEIHACRKIAFVRGPRGNQEAEYRFEIFKSALLAHGIIHDDQLILDGDFSREAGLCAVKTLHQKQCVYDALVCANDDMALGALKMFHELHIKVPEEVLVAGFDDIEESTFSSPPLTSVHQPLGEMGIRAVEAIINQIASEGVEQRVMVPATISIRQSCGCYRRSGNPFGLFATCQDSVHDELIKKFSHELSKIVLGIEQRDSTLPGGSGASQLVELFRRELSSKGSASFQLLQIISRMAWTLAMTGGDATSIVNVIAVMRQFASAIGGPVLPEHIENFIQNANVTVVEAVTRAQAHRRLDIDRHSILLRSAGQAIASAFDLEFLLDVISTEVKKLEIVGCWVSIYENTPRSLKCLRLVLENEDGIRKGINPVQAVFSVPEISPSNGICKDYPRSLLLEPLFFREDQIGIIVFDVKNNLKGYTYEILRLHISSALKGALLVKTVQEQTHALEYANRQLQKLQDTEHAYLEAIRHELELGREIQASFLPWELPVIPGWELCPAFQPARAVSGDFYDVFKLPDESIVFIISDVSGKDVGAALFMALIRTLIRALAEQALIGAATPLDAIRLTNNYLINHHYGNSGRYMYATCFMAQLDPKRNVITYVNAGHNPPAIVTIDGTIRRWIETSGPAIGIIPNTDFRIKELVLEPGELLFCYTDGITEARSPDGTLFTKERLAKILSQRIVSASDIVRQVDDAVKQHGEGNPPYDDITILSLRRLETSETQV